MLSEQVVEVSHSPDSGSFFVPNSYDEEFFCPHYDFYRV